MIKLENYEVMGWEHAIRGMRNPMNSWAKSDSVFKETAQTEELLPDNRVEKLFVQFDALALGQNDYDLAMKLANAGPVHGKFRRMITVYVDITAPLYWWKEFDTYKVGTVANSCSTMHKIHEKEFTLEDFSHDHLIEFWRETDSSLYMNDNGEYTFTKHPIIISGDNQFYGPSGVLKFNIEMLNKCRDLYLETKDKKYWWQMIQLLPSSYNQKRTVQLNYEVLAGIYKYRKDHKLDEWREFCKWIEQLPYSEIITGGNENGK